MISPPWIAYGAESYAAPVKGAGTYESLRSRVGLFEIYVRQLPKGLAPPFLVCARFSRSSVPLRYSGGARGDEGVDAATCGRASCTRRPVLCSVPSAATMEIGGSACRVCCNRYHLHASACARRAGTK